MRELALLNNVEFSFFYNQNLLIKPKVEVDKTADAGLSLRPFTLVCLTDLASACLSPFVVFHQFSRFASERQWLPGLAES